MKVVHSKSKLTLWIKTGTKHFGKNWARKHGESLSELVSDYLLRLKAIEEKPSSLTPIVSHLSGVIQQKKDAKEDYRKHLEKKYGHG